ncbi:MAG: GH3 auxin-responsive promoter family protein, partial [Planctomycetota bacterium]
AIVLHTDSGIFGYVLGDVVRFLSKSPLRLVFAGRTAHQLNAFGEHVSSGELDAAILHAARVTGSQVVEYTAAPEYPDAAHPEGRHVFFVEFVRTPEDLISFAAALDRHIAAGNEDYTTHRSFGLRSPIVIPVPQGAFLAWMARRGKLGGQNKVPRVISPQLRADLMEFVPATR